MVHVRDGRAVPINLDEDNDLDPVLVEEDDGRMVFDCSESGIYCLEEREGGTVTVHLKEQSLPITIHGVRNAYTKGSFYCCMLTNPTPGSHHQVRKFPIADVFQIIEQF